MRAQTQHDELSTRRVGSGFLVSTVPHSGHVCAQPTTAQVMVRDLGPGTTWRCDCGKLYCLRAGEKGRMEWRDASIEWRDGSP